MDILAEAEQKVELVLPEVIEPKADAQLLTKDAVDDQQAAAAAAPSGRPRSRPTVSALRRRLCAQRPPTAHLKLKAASAGDGGWGGYGRRSCYKKILRKYTNLQRNLKQSRGLRSELLRRREARLLRSTERREAARQTDGSKTDAAEDARPVGSDCKNDELEDPPKPHHGAHRDVEPPARDDMCGNEDPVEAFPIIPSGSKRKLEAEQEPVEGSQPAAKRSRSSSGFCTIL
jgi:hypothetical protein